MTQTLNFKSAVTGVVAIGIVTWVLLLYIKGIPQAISIEAAQQIPSAAGWVTALLVAFGKWGWKWRIFRGWLVQVSDLTGTWEGVLQSSWKDPATGNQIPPIKINMVIHHTLFNITCRQMTRESTSYSRAATISCASDGYLCVLQFTYANSPRVSVQYRSSAHDGACSLEIIENPNRKLVGKYWTERLTKGEMELRFISKELRQEFQ
jgi:hypothetical protein